MRLFRSLASFAASESGRKSTRDLNAGALGALAALPIHSRTANRFTPWSNVVAGMFMSIFEGQLGNA